MTYLPTPPIAAQASQSSPPHPTVASAVAAVRSWDDLPQPQRITLISALRLLERLYGVVPEAIRLDPEEISRRFSKTSPAALGVRASSLSAYKTCLRSVMRRLGVLSRPRWRNTPLTPAWLALRERLPDKFMSFRLQDFMAWCGERGIEPGAVIDATLSEYYADLRRNRMKGDPRDLVRRCAKAWNRAARIVPDWPSVELAAPQSTHRYTLSFEAYPPSLVVEIDVFRRRLSGNNQSGLYASGANSPRLRPVSVENRMQALRMALAALVLCGVSPRDIQSLADIVTEERMQQILEWHWERAGRKRTGNLGAIADTLRIIAKYHVGLTGESLESAMRTVKQAKPIKRSRMTEKNERRLAQFDDRTILAMTVNFAREGLMPIAAKQKQAGEHLSGAWTASLAVAVEILLRCPMRLSNLVELRFGHEIVHLGSGKQRHTHFLISADSSKTGEPLQWPINPELSVLIELFATEYRRVIGGAGSEYLFAGRDHAERPRAGCGLGTAITRAFREYIGIELHPHLYRALAGRLILDENPGAIEEIRQLLGHRTFTTAMEYYISAQPQRAAARHDSRISTLQRQTRMSAAVAFAEFRPFAFAGNRMKGGGHK